MKPLNAVKSTLAWMALLSSVLAGCAAGAQLAPTAEPSATTAPTATFTLVPSATASPTATSTLPPTPLPTATRTSRPSPTPTAIPSATPDCDIQNGTWQSEQTSGGWPAPILTFVVRNCAIDSLEIMVFPMQSELDIIQESGLALPIVDNQWTFTRSSGAGQLTVLGIFDSPNTASGSLNYTKGYDIFGTLLPKDVQIPWTAGPVQQ